MTNEAAYAYATEQIAAQGFTPRFTLADCKAKFHLMAYIEADQIYASSKESHGAWAYGHPRCEIKGTLQANGSWAFYGSNNFTATKGAPCAECKGTGRWPGQATLNCQACKGHGTGKQSSLTPKE